MLIKSLLVGLLLSPLAAAQSTLPTVPVSEAPIIDYQNRFLPAYGRLGMVVSPETLAGEIGLNVLKQGGNAVRCRGGDRFRAGRHATSGRQHRWRGFHADSSRRDR